MFPDLLSLTNSFIIVNILTITLIVYHFGLLATIKLYRIFSKQIWFILLSFSLALIFNILTYCFNIELLILLYLGFYIIGLGLFIYHLCKLLGYVCLYRTIIRDIFSHLFRPRTHRRLKKRIKEIEKTPPKSRNYDVFIPGISFEKEQLELIKGGFSFLILYDFNVDIKSVIGKIVANCIIEPGKDFSCRDYVNYICTYKPPFEIKESILEGVKKLSSISNPNMVSFSNKIYFIDAYSKNFSFKESVFERNQSILKLIDKLNIEPAENLGDIHSGTIISYNKIIKQMKEESSRPSICMIYDTLSSLDKIIEFEELTTYFYHCLPAEKKGYKMITFIFERIDTNEKYINSLKFLTDAIIEYKVEKNTLKSTLIKFTGLEQES